jgi:hypothetical protein
MNNFYPLYIIFLIKIKIKRASNDELIINGCRVYNEVYLS